MKYNTHGEGPDTQTASTHLTIHSPQLSAVEEVLLSPPFEEEEEKGQAFSRGCVPLSEAILAKQAAVLSDVLLEVPHFGARS